MFQSSVESGVSRALSACALTLACLAPACARGDDGAPVATPTVTIDRAEADVGSPVDVTYRFQIAPDAPPFPADTWVFVHVFDDDHERMWTDDHQPPVPAAGWKPGSTVEYTRTMFIPRLPYVGTAHVEIGLFSLKTGDRLPLAGESAGMREYRVARFDMRLQTDTVFVAFKDGWYDTEVVDGVETQWSRKEGVLAFRNPKRDIQVLLQLDQPVEAFPEPQRVDVRVGSTVVDTFPLPPQRRELRRIDVPANQLGEAETVEMAVTVDKTFVPARIPALASSDPRELGVRVFRAYIEPK